jgi:hypothetical protein
MSILSSTKTGKEAIEEIQSKVKVKGKVYS